MLEGNIMVYTSYEFLKLYLMVETKIKTVIVVINVYR